MKMITYICKEEECFMYHPAKKLTDDIRCKRTIPEVMLSPSTCACNPDDLCLWEPEEWNDMTKKDKALKDTDKPAEEIKEAYHKAVSKTSLDLIKQISKRVKEELMDRAKGGNPPWTEINIGEDITPTTLKAIIKELKEQGYKVYYDDESRKNIHVEVEI